MGGGGVWTPEKSQKYRVFLQYWSGSPEKATKSALNVGPSSARQRNAISIAFRWWPYDGCINNLDPLSPHQLKKSNLDPL